MENYRMESSKPSPTKFSYDSAKRTPSAFVELQGIFKYRDLIYQLVYRDIVTRYKRSVLGIAWTMLNPLGIMVVIAVVFSNLFRTLEDYPIYVLSGLVVWNFFSQTTVNTLTQTIWGGSLFHRIYLPRTTFAISAIGTGLVNIVLSIVPLVIIMLIIKMPLQLTLLFLPIPMIILAAFALGIGLIISTFSIKFPDVVEMYKVALTAWMYITPIIYPIHVIPESYRQWLIGLNPMYYIVEIFRLPIFHGVLPSYQIMIISSGVALITLILGWFLFSMNINALTYRI